MGDQPASWSEEVWRDQLINFCQRLVCTPSLSGQEEAVAALIRAEMERLGYDDVWVDQVGNVMGMIHGAGGPTVMLNCHMDQVDIGDATRWSHAPFGGDIKDGVIWGRGASDTKGAIATQVYAVGLMKATGCQFPGDVYVTCVVHEETGSWGTKFLLNHLKTAVAILGEATANQIACGHRGRTEVIVHLQGRATHASTASHETNLLFALAVFLQHVGSLSLPKDTTLGPAALTPTRCYTDQESGNMTPGQVWLHLDWRSLPGDKPADLLDMLHDILEKSCPPGVTGTAELLAKNVRSYTGMTTSLPTSAPGYLLDETHSLVSSARRILEKHLRRPVRVAPWNFTTDGGYLTEAGIPTIGFSPCEEQYAHTTQDQVCIELMLEAVQGTIALVAELPRYLSVAS